MNDLTEARMAWAQAADDGIDRVRGLGYGGLMNHAKPKESLALRPGAGVGAKYWKRSLGGFYQGLPHRLIFYFLVGGAFGALCYGTALLYYGPAWVFSDLSHLTVNALCSVLLFSGSLALIDFGASRLAGLRLSYSKRTVGRQWLVMFAGFVLAYTIYRAASRHLSELYGPWLLGYGRALPEQPLQFLSEFFLLFLFWLLIAHLCIQFAIWSQGVALKAKVAFPHVEEARDGQGKDRVESEEACLTLPNQNQDLSIPISLITHVTVEDHYCRLFQKQGNEIASMLLRIPLKSLEGELPAGRFARIHRSHLVNLEHVLGWRMAQGQRRLVMGHGIEDLPVSRHRFHKIEPLFKSLKRC